MPDKPANAGNEIDVIEGGAVTDLVDPLDIDPIAKQRASTARVLAYILVTVLALSVFAHYGVMAWLSTKTEPTSTSAAAALTDIFQTWLPVISGLSGSAVTYFFTRDK